MKSCFAIPQCIWGRKNELDDGFSVTLNQNLLDIGIGM